MAQVPFVDDVDEEIKMIDEENEESLKRQQEAFGIGSNTPPDQSPDKKDAGDGEQ